MIVIFLVDLSLIAKQEEMFFMADAEACLLM